MRFIQVPIAGAWLVEPEARTDERGFFARLWCRDEFANHGLRADFVQCNNSFSVSRGTLRGLHYQAPPHGEIKLISCVRGRVFDVLVDLRPDSPTFHKWFGAELTAENRCNEYLMTHLRMTEGVQLNELQRLGYPTNESFSKNIQEWMAAGLAEKTGGGFRLTLAGRLLCDTLTANVML